MHPALQNVSVESSQKLDNAKLAILNAKNSALSDKVPLGMSEAAMSKRLKNLEEFINSI